MALIEPARFSQTDKQNCPSAASSKRLRQLSKKFESGFMAGRISLLQVVTGTARMLPQEVPAYDD